MPSGRNRTRIMPGIHIVLKPLKYVDRYYVYAWRGGPCIHTQDDKYPVINHEILTKQQQAKTTRYGETEQGFEQIISGYRNSPEFAALAESTQIDYRRWLDRASERFGNTPAQFFDDREMRGDIIEWRNTWSDQPRTADKAAMIMNIILGYGLENGKLNINVAAKIKQLHHVNKADQIWEESHWEQWNQPGIPAQLNEAIFLASWTGLRLGDLVKITWGEVGKSAIIRMTNKGKKRNARAVIPILVPLKNWLNQTPECNRSGPILRNSRGEGWTPSGLGSVFQKHKPDSFDRTMHDLRGTFCTRLILKGLTDEETAMIMGWTSTRIGEIRKRYVDEARVILNLAERLSA